MFVNSLCLRIFLCSITLILTQFSFAQCSAFVNTFPYNEGFENSEGNWYVSNNSINSDWAWGTPAKPIITTAGGGSKCWITGGLSNSFYNNGEASFLQSPCFDISSLQQPIISFKIFWETESGYDGAGFQYSIDNGNSWINLGSVNDMSSCADSNWFNDNDVRYLNTVEGWSGNIQQGNGSGRWVTASHDLSAIKGATQVIFRFCFGAGVRNNNYDGFAIDDIFIGENAQGKSNFTYTCEANNEVEFMATSATCNNFYSWNFGDINSGVNNTSSAKNPLHTFSSPGRYTVQLSTTYTISKEIDIPGISISQKNVSCFSGNDGSASASVVPAGLSYSYYWNTTPAQTKAAINNLYAGIYVLTVQCPSGCNATQPLTITQPTAIVPNFTITNAICTKEGSINTATEGGIPPYNYLWSNNDTTSFINNLPANNYSVIITDSNKCTADFENLVVKDSTGIPYLFLGNDTAFCPGNKLVLHAGNFASYLWQDNSSDSIFTVYITGTYFVKVTDSNGCSASDTINVTVNCNDIYFPTAFTPNNDGLNDLFGPVGNLAAVKDYSFSIFNRWGQRIFYSENPYQKWNGNLNSNTVGAQTLVWFANYSLNNSKRFQKGTVILLR